MPSNVTPQRGFPVDACAAGAAPPVLDITAPALIKGQPGRLVRISVLVAGTTPGSANDSATLAGVAASNLVATIPNAVGTIALGWSMAAGITVSPGSGQTLAVAFY